MKITIEHDGKMDVYEDVKLFAGAVATSKKTVGLSLMDDESIDKADTAKVMLYHAAAAEGMRSLLKEARYVIAESIVGIISKTEGVDPFRVEAERSEE